MPDQAPPGLYQQLLTESLEQQLRDLQETLVDTDGLDPQEAPRLLARHLAGLARIALEHLSGGSTPEHQLALVNQLVGLLQSQAPRAISTGDLLHPSAQLLSEIRSTALLPGQAETIRPLIPLADSTLLVNASGEPSVGQALIHEVPSAQRIDLLCAFIKWSGLRLLQPALSEFLQAQPCRSLRVLTTVYLGATDRRALDWLVAHGAEVRVSYDTRRTRLHAKAWLFHRPGLSGATPSSTAYIGSSNLSTAALHDGLEWNVRLSAHDNEGILAKFQAAFESYWEEGEFEPYRASELEQRRFDRAAREESAGDAAAEATPLSFFDIRPYAYQQEILDKLSAERSLHGRWRNLVVAATGTGKTVIAALDYARQGGQGHRHPSLLFVAHRREILQQSLATFRQVLRDGSFGELLVDGQRPSQWRHVFASVQSLAGLDPADLAPDTFAVVIVDEFHHAASASYERWLRHLAPVLLLGLTATPERTGGEDILHWFGGRIAAELRLWSALEQGLLCPFHYFGLHDGTDLSQVEWRRNGYATEALSNLYTADDARLRLILRELADKVTNLEAMRALGFCVSVEHAHWMARKFVAAGLRAASLDASSPGSSAPSRSAACDPASCRSCSPWICSTKASTSPRSTRCCSCGPPRARSCSCSSSAAVCGSAGARAASRCWISSARPTATSASTSATAPCSVARATSWNSRSTTGFLSCRPAAACSSIGYPASGCFQICASRCPRAVPNCSPKPAASGAVRWRRCSRGLGWSWGSSTRWRGRGRCCSGSWGGWPRWNPPRMSGDWDGGSPGGCCIWTTRSGCTG